MIAPGGRLTAPVDHPTVDKLLNPQADRFATTSGPPCARDTPPELVPERFKDRAAFPSLILVLTAR